MSSPAKSIRSTNHNVTLLQEDVKGEEDKDIDYKTDQKFSEHLQNQAVVSDFARKKTITEQRQYLPVFAVREEVRLFFILIPPLDADVLASVCLFVQ